MKKIKPFPTGSEHEWFDDFEEIEDLSVWYSEGDLYSTYWGHFLFEGEYLEIMMICMICGHSVQGCSCEQTAP